VIPCASRACFAIARELSNGSTAVDGLFGNGSAVSLSPRQRPAL
jgi:hypothetical protein